MTEIMDSTDYYNMSHVLSYIKGQIACTVWICQTKGCSTSRPGQSRQTPDFITLLRIAHNLKVLVVYFGNFTFTVFWTVVEYR